MSGPLPRDPDAIADHEFAVAFESLAGAGLIMVAVSGGPDSTAMMHALAVWSARGRRPNLAVATVDHGLRPASRSEAEAVGAVARSLGLGHAILPWTGGRTRRPSQEAARRARYDLLTRHAAELGATHLVTAHTEDDQAETILIRLAAGSGVSGLAGMRAEVRRGALRHARPFLRFPKARLVKTCRARGWNFIEDPSNADPDFARARWRQLMPLLAGEGLDSGRLARLAERVARADAALDSTARAALERSARIEHDTAAIAFGLLAVGPPEIALRVLALALERIAPARPLRLDRLEACFEAFCEGLKRGAAVRRTLVGCVLALDRKAVLTVRPEGVRRRGRPDPVTPMEIGSAASLGMDPYGA